MIATAAAPLNPWYRVLAALRSLSVAGTCPHTD